MAKNTNINRVVTILLVAIVITFYLIVNSQQFRETGFIFLAMEMVTIILIKLKVIG